MQTQKLRATLNGMLSEKLKTYIKRDLNKETCTLIYQDIFLSIQEIILMIPVLKQTITNDGINYISQSYYDMIQVNGQFLIPDIFDKRVSVQDISTKELTMCILFLTDTLFQGEIAREIKHRN